MRTATIVKAFALLSAACMLCGTLAYAQQGFACVNLTPACFGFYCYQTGDATCTRVNGQQVTYNRIYQDGFVLGECQKGQGNCVTKDDWPCTAKKYYNAKKTDQICDDTTLRCEDTGAKKGCKSS